MVSSPLLSYCETQALRPLPTATVLSESLRNSAVTTLSPILSVPFMICALAVRLSIRTVMMENIYFFIAVQVLRVLPFRYTSFLLVLPVQITQLFLRPE